MRLGFCGLIFAGLTAFVVFACAQLTAAAAPQPAAAARFPSRVLRQTTFNIPFTVETARQPLEVQLYISRDQGQTWQLYARQNPSARFFPFHATADGEYWFASQTIDATQPPAEMAGRQPELHVVIDTAQPQFDLQAVVGPSREIQVTWRCSDPSIDPSSLKIEYQTGREQPWQPVASQSTMATNSIVAGRVTFEPRTAWVELQVRAEISDLARNKAVVSRRLNAASSGPQASQGQSGWRPASAATSQPDRPVALPPTAAEINADASRSPGGARDAPQYSGQRFPVGYQRGPIQTVTARGIPADPYANAQPSATNIQPSATNIQPSATNSLPSATNSLPVGTNGQPGATYGNVGAAGNQPSAPYAPGSTGQLGVGVTNQGAPTAGTQPPADQGRTGITMARPVSQSSGVNGSPAAGDVAPTTEWKSTGSPKHPAGIYGGTTHQSSSNTDDRGLVSGSGYRAQPSQSQPFVSQQIGAPGTGARATPETGRDYRDAANPAGPRTAEGGVDATRPSPLRTDSNRVSIHQLRMTSATEFELDYEFDAAAANGVRSVELWGTRDEGQTWSRWQVDADRRSPMDVQIDAEGTYGFRIVIVGNNGLAGDAPRNGDDAELWVGVDTTAPVVRINTATYGRGEQAGKLDIRWTASDASFGESPISIFFSDRASGPWTTIAAGVPNSGQFYWPIDPRVPEQLYLRIEARDRAGNQGEYRLPDPVNLAGFTPKARIRGIRPAPRGQNTSAPVSTPPASDLDSAPQATRNPYAYR